MQVVQLYKTSDLHKRHIHPVVYSDSRCNKQHWARAAHPYPVSRSTQPSIPRGSEISSGRQRDADAKKSNEKWWRGRR